MSTDKPIDFVHLHVHTQYSLLDGAIRLVERQKGMVAGLVAIAIEDTPRALEYRQTYRCAAAVVPGSRWQEECNAQYLSCFESYESSMAYPRIGS